MVRETARAVKRYFAAPQRRAARRIISMVWLSAFSPARAMRPGDEVLAAGRVHVGSSTSATTKRPTASSA
jgi:hypothetical protein